MCRGKHIPDFGSNVLIAPGAKLEKTREADDNDCYETSRGERQLVDTGRESRWVLGSGGPNNVPLNRKVSGGEGQTSLPALDARP